MALSLFVIIYFRTIYIIVIKFQALSPNHLKNLNTSDRAKKFVLSLNGLIIMMLTLAMTQAPIVLFS